MSSIARFFQNEEAATAVEYSVMLALIVLVAMAAITSLGSKTRGLWISMFNDMCAHGM
jgi:Flp pilus assembly pilin Flp